MFEIAAFFSEAARRRVAALPFALPLVPGGPGRRTWTDGTTFSADDAPRPVDPATGDAVALGLCCPLGALFVADGHAPCSPVPSPVLAAVLLVGLHDRRLPTIIAQVARFVAAWDTGELADLAAALGVAEEPESTP